MYGTYLPWKNQNIEKQAWQLFQVVVEKAPIGLEMWLHNIEHVALHSVVVEVVGS